MSNILYNLILLCYKNIPNKLEALHESSKAVLEISAHHQQAAAATSQFYFGSPIKYN